LQSLSLSLLHSFSLFLFPSFILSISLALSFSLPLSLPFPSVVHAISHDKAGHLFFDVIQL
jgi:hypothetical protein